MSMCMLVQAIDLQWNGIWEPDRIHSKFNMCINKAVSITHSLYVCSIVNYEVSNIDFSANGKWIEMVSRACVVMTTELLC